MTLRAVYDTMVFFQWAALRSDRQHATISCLYDGSVRLCMGQALLDEISQVLGRPEIQARAPSLTSSRVRQILDATVKLSEWIPDVPAAFSWPEHPDDDHLFNLAIAAKADFLVTWESRIKKLAIGGNLPTLSD